MSEPKQIYDKYDLMHLSTPEFAKALIEWDLGAMKAVTKNRVLKWIKDASPTMGGKARQVYEELCKKFDLGRIQVDESVKGYGRIWYSAVPDYVIQELNKLQDLTEVTFRMAGQSFWKRQLGQDSGYMNFDPELDMTDLHKAIARMNEESKVKRDNAVQFVEQGGKMQFSY